ncbi:MAG: TIGR00282 family metallophosphoesterase [Patescibacteria group bacterium]|jgi:hypothetical protein
MLIKKNSNLLTILFFGDIIGKIGRRALLKYIPKARAEFKPDLVIANVENLAHGKSVTQKTWQDLVEAGVDFGTSGNHIFKKPEGVEMLDQDYPIIRPANYPPNTPGRGFQVVETAKGEILLANLLGQLFMKDDPPATNPFNKLTEILDNHPDIKMKLVDFHAEATSEKVAMGLLFDGRVSAVLGTHTHIPTADGRILSRGTGYITDAGMVGAKNSIIGGAPENLLLSFEGKQEKSLFEIPETGVCLINAVLLKIDPATGLTVEFKRLDAEIEV